LSTIEVFANSKADHGLAPLGAGRGYAPVLSTLAIATTVNCGDTYVFAIIGGTTALVGDVPSAGIPVRGSAKDLLSVRTGSIG
jgi:hypothetical protein